MRGRQAVLFAALVATWPASARPPVETKLSVAIDRAGRAKATLTITNNSEQPICVMPYMERVFLTAADGSRIEIGVSARPSYTWPGDMPVVWDQYPPRTFDVPLATDSFFPGAERMRQAAHATFDFEAYDCAEMFADRAHVRPRYKRTLKATPVVSP